MRELGLRTLILGAGNEAIRPTPDQRRVGLMTSFLRWGVKLHEEEEIGFGGSGCFLGSVLQDPHCGSKAFPRRLVSVLRNLGQTVLSPGK